MNVPKLTNLVDEIALQKSIALILASEERLATVPVLPEIKIQQESELLVDALWQLPRAAFSLTADGWTVNTGPGGGGLVGGGLLVEMPEMDYDSPGVREGSPASWKVGIVGFSEPNTNFLPGVGIQLTSSQLCQIAMDVTQMLNVYGFGTFQTARAAITAAQDWMTMKPGVVAHRLTIKATVGRVITARSAMATATIAAGVCTLACSDSTATIRYTTDFTEPVSANPNAAIYTAPFAVTSGQTVKFATSKSGAVTSQIHGAVAP